MRISEIYENDHLIEVGRKAVEDSLLHRRDARFSLLGYGNGLVVREKDGGESSIIRLSTGDAIVIALKAIEAAVAAGLETRRPL